jgi:hypothetical protein
MTSQPLVFRLTSYPRSRRTTPISSPRNVPYVQLRDLEFIARNNGARSDCSGCSELEIRTTLRDKRRTIRCLISKHAYEQLSYRMSFITTSLFDAYCRLILT